MRDLHHETRSRVMDQGRFLGLERVLNDAHLWHFHVLRVVCDTLVLDLYILRVSSDSRTDFGVGSLCAAEHCEYVAAF